MEKVIIISGPAGSGKTDLAKLMADEFQPFNEMGIANATEYGTPNRTYAFDEATIMDDRVTHERFKRMKRHRSIQYVVTTQNEVFPPWLHQYAKIWRINPIKL